MRGTKFLKLEDDDVERQVGNGRSRKSPRHHHQEDDEVVTVEFQDVDLNNISPTSTALTSNIDQQNYSSVTLGFTGYGGNGAKASVGLLEQEKRKSFYKGMFIVFVLGVVPLFIIMIALSAVIGESDSSSGSSSKTEPFSYSSYQATSTSMQGAVASDTGTCSEIGLSILKQGGNAVEAAIATAFCLGVLSPASSGIGGGCFLLIHNATTGKSEFIDAREVAPSQATPNMFVSNPKLAQNGGLAIATLGEVKGLELAYQRHKSGKIAWKDLVLPAARLAKKWTVSVELAAYISVISDVLYSKNYTLLSNLYMKNKMSKLKEAGDVMEQPQLAHTLEQIANYGSDYLYVTMADTLAQEVQQMGGILTADDIRDYEPSVPDLVYADIARYKYVGVRGSSSGGAVVAGMLKFMNAAPQPLVSLGYEYYHWLAEAMKHTFAIRLFLGDPDYNVSATTTAAFQALLDDNYMSGLARTSHSEHALDLAQYGGIFNTTHYMQEDHGTSHVSVIDQNGNAVALTSTVNTEFGSKVISPSTGILFNNQMDDFSIPNATNYFGLFPSPYNYPEPRKKPLSSMSPSLLLDQKGRVVLVGGASGGPRIITGTVQVILNHVWKGMDLLSSVLAPRIHTQLLPDSIDVEDHRLAIGQTITADDEVGKVLQRKGHHNVTYKNRGFGVTQFIGIQYIDDGQGGVRVEAVSDPRKDGHPAIWT